MRLEEAIREWSTDAGPVRCDRCGGTLRTLYDNCKVPLEVPCDGFRWYDANRPMLLRAWRSLPEPLRAKINGAAVAAAKPRAETAR